MYCLPLEDQGMGSGLRKSLLSRLLSFLGAVLWWTLLGALAGLGSVLWNILSSRGLLPW